MKTPVTAPGGNVAIVGPRNSGKTTYLAGLAYWPRRKEAIQKGDKTLAVQPINNEARELQEKAENIILQGESFTATRLPKPQDIPPDGLIELPSYLFDIKIQRKFQQVETIHLNFRDYSGELFDLELPAAHPAYQDLWQDCFKEDVAGCLLLLAGWQPQHDRYYRQKIDRFMELIDQNNRSDNYRIAVAMSKCERGELWSGRLEAELDIFLTHLPQTQDILASNIPAQNLRFFALSTFGVLERQNPRPNRINLKEGDDSLAVLREPVRWKPYNLIAPLYWLSTGKIMEANI